MDSIENWYEKILIEKIHIMSQDQIDHADKEKPFDESMWSDIACLTLNHLPPRYVSHAVDMRFYLSPQEHREMEERVEEALQNAIAYVKQHPDPNQTPHLRRGTQVN